MSPPREQAVKEAKKKKVGEDYARLCKETETEYQLGRKKGKVVIAKSAVKEVVGEALFNDQTKCCPFWLLSTSQYPHAMCPLAGKKGHESATSVAHRTSTYPPKAKGKLLAMLTTLAATAEAFHVAPPAGAGVARGCGVPALASAAFDKVGGMIFVPVRYSTPHVPEFGLHGDERSLPTHGNARPTLQRRLSHPQPTWR